MKISKLFHWLYAILLLLPVFSIGGKMLYVIFNQNAKDSYYGHTINEVEYTETNNLVIDENYLFVNTNNSMQTTSLVYVANFTPRTGGQSFMQLTANDVKAFAFTYSGSILYLDVTKNDNTHVYTQAINNNVIVDLSFTFTTLTNVNNYFNGFYHITYNNYSFMDNSFYYAINQINAQPIFAWAKDSFLVEPIAYVSELFGLSNNSPLITLLSYWLNMSIIWLCFDIIMYVPLMAHRWLDKGAID